VTDILAEEVVENIIATGFKALGGRFLTILTSGNVARMAL
jgi:hypothetical protein